MKIKNLTVKPIGFGSTIILPDETGTLPSGYGKNHPTVKYYLSRKWIAEVGKTNDDAGDGEQSVNVNVNVNTGGDNTGGGGDGTGNDGAGAGNTSGNSGANKPLDRMNKEELQALAFQRGVEFVDADTRQVLIDKIRAAQNSGE